MTSWKKIKKIINSEIYGKVLILYIFIIGTIILVNAKTNLDYGLAIFNYLLGFLLCGTVILVRQSNNSLQRLLNYINIYKTLPNDVIIKKEEELYNMEKKIVQKNYKCLYNNHDIISYIVTNPGTKLAKYFEKYNETLNFGFFKNKFLVIDESGLFIFKKQYIRR